MVNDLVEAGVFSSFLGELPVSQIQEQTQELVVDVATVWEQVPVHEVAQFQVVERIQEQIVEAPVDRS